MISPRWFIAGLAVIMLGLGIGLTRMPVYVDAKVVMECSQVVTRYHNFVQDGTVEPDRVVPSPAWADACSQAITQRRTLEWPLIIIGDVALAGVGLIQRRPTTPLGGLNPPSRSNILG